MFVFVGHQVSRCQRFNLSQTRPKSNNYQTDYLEVGRLMEPPPLWKWIGANCWCPVGGSGTAGVGEREREGLKPLANFSVGEPPTGCRLCLATRR